MIVEEMQAEYIKGFSGQYRLTPREIEILQLLVSRGYSNQEMASYFMVSIKTIVNQMYRLMKKMDCRSSREVLSLCNKYMLHEELKKASTSISSPRPASDGADQ